jgi:hypothetical protein
MTWFVQQSGHQSFKDTSIPEECPQPFLGRDSDTNINTNISVNKNVESSYETSHQLKILQKPYLCMILPKDLL